MPTVRLHHGQGARRTAHACQRTHCPGLKGARRRCTQGLQCRAAVKGQVAVREVARRQRRCEGDVRACGAQRCERRLPIGPAVKLQHVRGGCSCACRGRVCRIRGAAGTHSHGTGKAVLHRAAPGCRAYDAQQQAKEDAGIHAIRATRTAAAAPTSCPCVHAPAAMRLRQPAALQASRGGSCRGNALQHHAKVGSGVGHGSARWLEYLLFMGLGRVCAAMTTESASPNFCSGTHRRVANAVPPPPARQLASRVTNDATTHRRVASLGCVAAALRNVPPRTHTHARGSRWQPGADTRHGHSGCAGGRIFGGQKRRWQPCSLCRRRHAIGYRAPLAAGEAHLASTLRVAATARVGACCGGLQWQRAADNCTTWGGGDMVPAHVPGGTARGPHAAASWTQQLRHNCSRRCACRQWHASSDTDDELPGSSNWVVQPHTMGQTSHCSWAPPCMWWWAVLCVRTDSACASARVSAGASTRRRGTFVGGQKRRWQPCSLCRRRCAAGSRHDARLGCVLVASAR